MYELLKAGILRSTLTLPSSEHVAPLTHKTIHIW